MPMLTCNCNKTVDPKTMTQYLNDPLTRPFEYFAENPIWWSLRMPKMYGSPGMTLPGLLNSIMDCFCIHYEVELDKIEVGQARASLFLEKSDHSDGSKPKIHLGIYSESERQFVAFFHEMGHIVSKRQEDNGSMEPELGAWVAGIQVAKLAGITFGTRAMAFAEQELWKNGPRTEPHTTIQQVLAQYPKSVLFLQP